MKKLLSAVILHALLLPVSNAQTKLFDQAIQLKTCNISIEANHFIATTFIEMEFYNSRDVEVEGYQSFRLNKGQVITAFQLDLNGKYRDGSIEEKWKANNAYNTIVGKRIDPAILQMNYDNSYSLRIYPIPARSSRKVTMTIDQLMIEDSNKLNYDLPLGFISNTETFHLEIRASTDGYIPIVNYGLLRNRRFNLRDHVAGLAMDSVNIKLDKPVSFSIPLKESRPQICVSRQDGISKFLVRFNPSIQPYYRVNPKTLAVFWDVSASSRSRDIKKELDFLEQYISLNKITTATITLFNQKIQERFIMDTRADNFYYLRNYLKSYPYSGATTFGNLDLSASNADVILVFSDGKNSYGNSLPKTATIQVNCIVSTYGYDEWQLQQLIAQSGGSVINLYKTAVADAIKKVESAKNFLMRYNSLQHSVKLNEKFPVQLGRNILLSGTFEGEDQLQLLYGNSSSINRTEHIFLSARDTCKQEIYRKVQMLKSYDSMTNKGTWYDMVIFGLTEKVVTQRTSFLVLERIEDYIKYNIAPPKELEEACAERNYVYKNEYKIKALKTFSEQDLLKTFADNYNQYVKWWDPKEELINPDKVAATQASAMDGSNDFAQTKSNTISSTSTVAFKSTGSSELTEVIVTGAFGTKRTARSSASNVQNINSSQLNTIRNTDLNNALAGKVAGIQIRSQSAAKLGMTGLIRLRGENGINPGNGALYVLDGTIIPDASDINVDDIEDVTVLQGPSAAALFGPDGANGAIVINSKRGKSYHSYSWAQYRLKDVDDVDYMQQIKESGDKEVWDDYVELEKNHQGQAGFYFDMADHFFGRKLNDKGMEILLNGIESCYDNKKALKVAAYILETRKLFKEAIIIYEDIVRQSPGNLISKRDLALAYFQNGEYQKSVNMYYKVISDPGEEYYYHTGVKEVAMNEMNAVISMHKTVLDLSAINLNLVKQLPLDLKITVESNYGYVYDATITDPNMAESSYEKTSSKKDTRFTVGYGYRYDDVLNEYSVKKAIPGSYKIEVDAYRYNSNYPGKTPVYVRVVVFKNFQKANQSLEVRHIAMDDQHGTVEVAEVKW